MRFYTARDLVSHEHLQQLKTRLIEKSFEHPLKSWFEQKSF